MPDELEDVQDRIDRTKVSMRREQEQLAESADSRQEEMRALEAEMAQFNLLFQQWWSHC